MQIVMETGADQTDSDKNTKMMADKNLQVRVQAKQIRIKLWLIQTELERELHRDQHNAKVYVQEQVQLNLQCENFRVLLWKPILSQFRSQSH